MLNYAQVKDHEVIGFKFNKEDLLYKDAFNETRVRSHHKRALAVKNRGNLPVYITAVTIDDKGCSAYGFTVDTCGNFQVGPGDTYYMYISFATDGVIA